ncbi:MAG: hypothetical protein ACJAUO_002070 [Sediminicola sp.]|jgi:hypothetical protein
MNCAGLNVRNLLNCSKYTKLWILSLIGNSMFNFQLIPFRHFLLVRILQLRVVSKYR